MKWNNKVLFITGIDTNIGKTYATTFLLQKLQKEGLKVVSQKPIQTGCEKRSEDLDIHDKILNFSRKDLKDIAEKYRCSYLFPLPSSPHLAAQETNCSIDLAKIDQDTEELLKLGFDQVLMEGAGGLKVPLNSEMTFLDFITERNYPVALVTSPRLGSINHSLLSIDALLERGLQLEYLIYNLFEEECDFSEKKITDDTKKFLQEYLIKVSPHTKWVDLPFIEL